MLDAATASWEDVAAGVASGLIAILPVGAVEQHGPHLPLLTDTVLATGVARRIAESTDALLLPAIAYGDAWTAEGWAGTLSLSPDTLRATVIDLLALDDRNPRAIFFQLNEIRNQIAKLPGSDAAGPMPQLPRRVLELHTGLAVLSPDELTTDGLLKLRGATAGLSGLIADTYFG